MVDVVISPTQATIDLAPSALVVEIGKGPTGPGLPPGGAVGDFPVKKTTTDYDFEFKPTGAVGLALLARSGLTAGSLLLGNGTGAPTELATTSYGRSFLGLADIAAGRSLLGLATSDSPTFSTVTATGVLRAGTTGSGTGGNVQLVHDGGANKWLAGIPGVIGARNYSIYDLVNGERLSIDGTTGKATFSGLVGFVPSSGYAAIGINGSALELFCGPGNETRLSITQAGVATFSGTTASTSTTTGALVVGGGVGVGGAVNSGGTVQASVGASRTGLRSTSTLTTAFSPTAFNDGNITIDSGNATGSYCGIRFTCSASHEALFASVQTAAGVSDFVWSGYSGSSYAERLRLKSDATLVVANKITTLSAVPASFADLAAVRAWLSANFT